MGVPKTPVSLEKKPWDGDPFVTHTNNHGHGQIIDTSESFIFPFFDTLESFAFPSFEDDFAVHREISRLTLSIRSLDDHLQSLSRFAFVVRPHLYESRLRDFGFLAPELERDHEVAFIATPPDYTSFFTNSFWARLSEMRSRRYAPQVYDARVKNKPDLKTIRKSLFLLYREFQVFFFKHPAMLSCLMMSYPEQKKISRYCPSHFWQVLE